MEIGAAPAITTADADGEQRRVALMFADISGSTELVEHLDAESAANLLDPLIGMMTDTVERYAGSVSPRGDGILAVFGLAGATEDNTVRACFAALEILRRLDGQEARVRIGIHHGEVAILSGRRGPSRENLFGPVIHVAARLEQTTEPGSISLSLAAYELARDFVEAEPLPSLRVKGMSKPLERYRLLGIRTASRWRARLGRGLTPLIGRQAELATFAAFLRGAAGPGAHPGAHLLQVLGQAGTGKSRLVHEALRGETARACQVITLTGPVHRGYSGYDPLAHWLRELTANGLIDARQPRDPVAALPGAAALSDAEREQLGRYLGVIEAVPARVVDLDTVAPLHVIAPIAKVIAAMGRGRPVILSCEDGETLDNTRLGHLAAVSAAVAACGSPIALVVSSRRPLKLPADRFTTRKTLRLGQLAPDEARQLLVRLYPELRRRADLIEPILAKADGNPLFLEEVAALLLAREDQHDKADPVRPSADADAIPDRIEALIADRLARIPQQGQTLLRVCAVLGSVFSPDILAAVTGLSAGTVDEQLTKLKAERLLFDVPAVTGPRLGFNHPLVRDVAYRTLLPSRRRGIHETVLRLLERTETSADADELAHHAVNARLWPEALRYLRRAAVVAAERAGYATAERHLRQALKIAETQPQDWPARSGMVEIMVGLRSLLALDLRHAEADALLDRAQVLAGDLEPERRLSISVKRIRTLNTRGQVREAVTVAGQTRQGASAIGHVGLQLAASHFLGQSYFYIGRFSAGEATLTEAARLLPASSDTTDVEVGSPAVLIHATRAGIRGFLGRFRDAERDAAEAVAIAASRDSAYDRCFAQVASGLVHLQQRQLAEAEAAFTLGLEGAERHVMRALLPLLKAGLGHTLLLGGSINAAIAALTEAHEIGRDHGRVLSQMWADVGLTAAYGSTGGRILALRHAEEAVRLGAQHTLRGFLVGALRGRGALLADEAETREAGLHSVRQALALARKLGMRPGIAHCLATLATISGRESDAVEAAAAYRALGMGEWAEHVFGADGTPVQINIIAA